MPVCQLDPLTDPRWTRLVDDHPLATVFHSPGWLEALKRTYGYQPAALTTSPSDHSLQNGLVFCRIASWLTGRRLVSLPFTDHCDVLASGPGDADCLLAAFSACQGDERAKYAEVRPLHAFPACPAGFRQTHEFYLHRLDLRPSAEDLFRSFHKDSIQRKIRRSEREGLTLESGRSPALLDKFYRLFATTRRRHELPPTPREWFSNLIACLDTQLKIWVAAKDDRPIASILTLQFKDTLIYKYGGSDANSHAMGGMQALFWRAIQEAKRDGVRCLDFGRSDLENQGLITFKNHWGTSATKLQYFRHPSSAVRPLNAARGGRLAGKIAGKVFSVLPSKGLSVAGKLLYKHIG